MKNLKSKIIPNEIKENIDEILENQLLNANRYFAETNTKISKLMNIEKINSPSVFLERLIERWNWHNLFYEELLEPAYLQIIRNYAVELSPSEIDDLIKIYKTMCQVDEATLVMSGAIKKNLEYNLDKIPVNNEYFDKNTSKFMLITPPSETFFATYKKEHLYYIYLLKTDINKANEYKEYLKEKYHANDEVIFNSRLKKQFNNMFFQDTNTLLKIIKQLTIPDSYKTAHFYFTLENPERKAMNDLILYDNLDEKLIACNLIGISGFLLRKKILEYLDTEGILKNDGYIYEFSNDLIIESLEKLKVKRKLHMEKNIKPYKQTGYTCTIVCMMMVLQYNGLLDNITEEEEKKLYGMYQSKYMDGTPFSTLAMVLAEKGFEVELFHKDNTMFNNDKYYISNYLFELAVNEYKEYVDKAKKKGAKVSNGVNINSQLLKEQLEEGKLLIVAGSLGYDLHAILICGYDENSFIICDPLSNTKQRKTYEEIEKFMDTLIGTWFLSINNLKDKKDELIDNLEYFNYKANEYLDNNKLKEKKDKVRRLIR